MIAITNGKVVTVTGETYEQGTVLVENGKIVAVGANIDIPANAEIINAEGMWVTPGLIDPHTHMCNFNEPRTNPSIPLDGNEMSDPITPQVRAIDAVNPYDYAVDVVRQAGFTTVCILPGSANLIGGRGTVIKLRNVNTAEEMEVPGCEQMKFAMGENPKRCYGTDRKLPMTRMGVAALIRETLYKAKVYSDKFIRISQEDKVITGYGFESDQNLTEYQIKNTTGVFTVEDKAPEATGSQQADSIKIDKQ